MWKTLITSRDSRGTQAVRIFEAAYDKSKLDADEAQRLNAHPHFAPRLKELIRELSAPAWHAPFPQLNDWFDLEVDNAGAMAMLSEEEKNAGAWVYRGDFFSGRPKYRVRLIELGFVADPVAANLAANAMGYRLLQGQGRKAFMDKYPEYDGRAVVFGGNHWQDPTGSRNIACVDPLTGKRWFSFDSWHDDLIRRDDLLWAAVELDA